MRLLLITFLLCLLSAPAVRSASRNQAAVDSLNSALAVARTPADSLPLLYDLYDLGTRAEKRHLNRMIYPVAKRAGDTGACIDILEQLASFYLGSDSIQALVEAEMATYPPSPAQQEGMVFVRLMRETTQTRLMTTAELRRNLYKAVKDANIHQGDTADIYSRFENSYRFCLSIPRDSHGELGRTVLMRLDLMVRDLPKTQYALRNMYFTRAAVTYTDAQLYDLAVQADKNLLAIMTDLQQRYVLGGREFRNYNTNRYVSYRRLLSNYPALSAREIEDYYERILELAKIDEDVREDLESNNLAHIYYLMATKRYADALPYLKPYLEKHGSLSSGGITKVYKMAEEAARATGNSEMLLKAMNLYLRRLEEIQSKSLDDNSRELKLLEDYVKLRERAIHVEKTASEKELNAQKRLFVLMAIAVALLILLALFIFRQYRHAKTLSISLANSNSDLRDERDRLEHSRHELTDARDEARRANRVKSDFISNISHEISEPLHTIAGFSQMIVDSVDDDKRPYLERYSSIVNLNIDFVQSILSDVLNISALDSGKMSLSIQSVSVHEICNMVIDSVQLRVEPGVMLCFASASKPDIVISTDRRRVEQVLINMLQNSTKFTVEGSINLSYEVDEAAGTVTFAVTDTGVGIPAGKHEVIFGRYEKLDPGIHGNGLGLAICRLIAKLLKGQVWADPTYRGGARFFFRIPLHTVG